MSKLLYIGSGLHLEPIKHFPETKEFVFVDTQPRSEFDVQNSFYDGFYRKNFYSGLMSTMDGLDFILEKTEELDSEYFTNILSLSQRISWLGNVKQTFPYICPTLLVFFNYKSGQKLKYYISTNILYNMYFDLENDIKSSDGLIVSGYHPDKILLNYLTPQINLFCYDRTCYKIDPNEIDNLDNLINWAFENPDKINNYFSNIIIVERENGNKISCENLLHMDKLVRELNLRKINENY